MQKTLVVLLPIASNLKITLLENIVSDIRYSLQGKGLTIKFLLAVNKSKSSDGNDPESLVTEFAQRYDDVSVYTVADSEEAITEAGGGRYVYGFFEASKLGDYVVDIDSAGGHDPKVIGDFVDELLAGKRAVLSTRFFMNGAKNLYPIQRQISSLVTTFLSNLMLGVGVMYPDMASGYQGFRSDVLREVFLIVPPDKWITLQTTTAFIETELRSYVLWYLKHSGSNLKQDVKVLPIVYGILKRGVNFPSSVGMKALRAFSLLWKRKPGYIEAVVKNSGISF